MESVNEEGSSLGPRASCTLTVTVEPAPAGLLLPAKSSLSPTASPACRDGRPPSPAGSTPCPSRLRMSPCSSITPQQVQAWARHAGVSHMPRKP